MTDENKMGPPPAGATQQPYIGCHPNENFASADMVYFACVLQGDWPRDRDPKIADRCPDLGKHYVEQLYSMVSRYAPLGVPWRFICFTDRHPAYFKGIPTRALPEGLHGYFTKLYLFAPEAFPAGARVVYFDLDTCITGSLEPLATLQGDTPFALRNVWAPGHVGSGIMSFRAGSLLSRRIWLDFKPLIGTSLPYSHPNPARPPPRLPNTLFQWGPTGTGIRTDEQWLMAAGWAVMGRDWLPLQDKTTLLSYKHEVIGAMTRNMRLPGPPPKPAGWDPQTENVTAVFFHGEPRPHRVIKKWNPFWRGVMDHPQTKVGQGFISEDWEG